MHTPESYSEQPTELIVDNPDPVFSPQLEASDEEEKEQIIGPKRKVRYHYVISLIFNTYRRRSRVFEFDATDGWFKRFSIGLPYSALTFFVGWWGFPYGLLLTPVAIFRNTVGGEDVTFRTEEQEKSQKFVNNKLQDEK